MSAAIVEITREYVTITIEPDDGETVVIDALDHVNIKVTLPQ